METDIRELFNTHFVAALEEALEPISAAWNNIKNAIMEPLQDIFDWIEKNLVSEDTAIWGKVLKEAKSVANNIKTYFINAFKAGFNGLIKGINRINVDVPSWVPEFGGKNFGFSIPELNKGGLVPGYGSRDTIPAMLTPGEFVITKASAQALGMPMLNALNKGKFPVAQESPTARGGIMNNITNNVSNNYNNVSVNAAGVNADDVANVVMRKLADLNRQNIGGN